MTGSERVIINLGYTNVFHCYLLIQCHLGDQGISSNGKPAISGPSKISFISIPKASFLFSYKISTFGVLGARWHAFGRNLLFITDALETGGWDMQMAPRTLKYLPP